VPEISHLSFNMIKTLKRYARLYRVFLSQNLKEDMIYRSNFLTLVLMDIGFVSVSVILFKIIYNHVDSIAGWTFHQSIILIGSVGIVRELAYLTFRRGFLELGNHIRTGTFDLFMVKPIVPNLHLAFRHVSLSESLGEALSGIVLVSYGLAHTYWNWIHLLIYMVFILNSLMIYYGFSLLINSIVFWVIKTQELNTIIYFFMETSRYPGDIFRGIGKWIFTFIIPIGIIATVPASVLTGRLRWGLAVTALFVGISFLSIGLLVWKKSIEHYSSASG